MMNAGHAKLEQFLLLAARPLMAASFLYLLDLLLKFLLVAGPTLTELLNQKFQKSSSGLCPYVILLDSLQAWRLDNYPNAKHLGA